MNLKEKSVSPVVAAIIILVIIVIAGALIYRYSGPPAHSGMTPEMAQQLKKMFGNGAPGSGGGAQNPYAGHQPAGAPQH
ncbi:archaeal flagellin-like protein [Chthonomonas calidirosea]|uniref:Archaeal flagellin N-terminal-like domain n=1 Tax=Chthonomonas calidirosea (strain DSM 23976 / ICMP 18418 / T49) TaxID=1303518 RepID=S0EY73_CHTCT|nr:archaellin/type IV pilin N-terminal domain-containing protein [Chthonomonas calidirosea]CCW35265.1 archaeal flagellin N-terminal-like domain [Chthonomonas calidirosea T49]CEK19805.1 archaeal flagellin-like protein [Chthonomonas calidirosea]CEK19810.1 archaeal flagellin-like protein [Chthonomonas calidirosea]CEK20718.1 archaeal flagellin-like protein [Chthonomonas calidirosea]